MSKVPLSPIEPFGEWLPDLGDLNGGLITAKNCVSYGGIYKPIDQLNAATDALPDDVRGVYSMRALNGSTHTFAGTDTKLYKLNGTAWDDVTRLSGGDYNTGNEGFWSFCNYGDLVIATNYADDIQVFDVSSDTEFSQLSATAPRARYGFVLNNFYVTLDTVDGDGTRATRVRWSPIGDPAGDWTPSISTQAGFNDLRGGGFANMAGVGNDDFGIIIQDNAIWRMEYVGGDEIFRFDLNVQERGTANARTVVSDGELTYFLDEDGFYATDGVQVVTIGQNKIDDWFYYRYNSTYSFNVTAAVDPVNRLIAWAYPTVIDGGPLPQEILLFSVVDKRWTYIEQPVNSLFGYLTTGYTLEDIGAEYATLEDVPYTLDSRFWQGGRFVFGAITSDYKLGGFNGDPYTAVIETTEVRPNQNGRVLITGVQPYIELGTVTMRLGYKNLLNDTVAYTPSQGINSITGEIDTYLEARYVRAEFTISGDWDNAKGLAYRSKARGFA